MLAALHAAHDVPWDMMLEQERYRRVLVEGPPDGELREVVQGFLVLRVRSGGKPWTAGEPCVICDQEDCLRQVRELSPTGGSPLESNWPLLKMLCAWRRHVKDTKLIKKHLGGDQWKQTSICTSELTFLGRKRDGIIAIVAATRKPVDSLSSLVSLMDAEPGVHSGVKALSVGFAVLIAMYMDWDLYTAENVDIVQRLLRKVRKEGRVGLDTYLGSPWHVMFQCIQERRRIPDTAKEFILSRAHLP
jgi:hypothetical protein